MQKSIDNPAALVTEIAALRSGLVVLDGCHGAGKSCLAESIGRLLSECTIIHADNFIERKDVGYLAGMNAGALYKALRRSLKSSVVVYDGILARDFLEMFGLQPALSVYVQLNSTFGIPADLDTLDQEDDEPESFNDMGSTLAAEVADYHRRQHPRRNADIIYIRVAD